MTSVKLPLEPYFTTEGLAKMKKQLADLNTEIAATDKNAGAMYDEDKKFGSLLKGVDELKKVWEKQFNDNMTGDQKNRAMMMEMASEGFKRGSEGLKDILTQSFDVMQTIYKELKKSSPLIEAIDQIFQLAWTLFFMPLGNKLGELLIPAVLELVDGVVDLWGEIGDGKLGDIFDYAIQKGVELMGDFFNDIGDKLIAQGGFLADIGKVFNALSDFVRNHLTDIVGWIIKWAEFNMSHMGTIIALIGTFMSLHYALQLATMATIAAAAPGLSKVSAYMTAGAIAVGAGGTMASFGLTKLSGLPMAEGGIVPARPGGTHIIAGEAGEDEFIVPRSKVSSFVDSMASGDGVKRANTGSTNHYTINISGYTDNELKSYIKDIVNDEVSRSRIKSGF